MQVMSYTLVLLLGCATIGYAATGHLLRRTCHDWLACMIASAIVGILLFSWLGILLAAMGLFRAPVVLALAVAGLAGRVWQRLRGRRSDIPTPRITVGRRGWWRTALVVAAAIVLCWLYARPAESYMVVDDSSIYTLGGLQLARSGSLWAKLDSPWLVTPELVRTFFQFNPSGMITRHFGSFYQYTFGQQLLEVGFLPLPKVWTALCAWLFGPQHATLAAPFFGLLSIAAFWGLGKRRLGAPGGLVAALLLALSLPQVWYARYPISEIYAQALVLGGLYLLAEAHANASEPHAPALVTWSALALALLVLVRFEALLMLAPIVLLVAWAGAAGTTAERALTRRWLLSLALGTGAGLILALSTSRYYLFDQTLGTAPLGVMRLLLAGLTMLLAAAYWVYRIYRRDPEVIARIWSYIRPRAARAVAVLWALALAVSITYGLANPWGEVMPHWVLQYLTPSGVVLAVSGIIVYLVSWQGDDRRVEGLALLGAAAPFMALYALRPMVVPVHPWAVRRLVPLVTPALAFGVGALAARCIKWLSKPMGRLVGSTRGHRLALVLVLAVAGGQILLQWQLVRPVIDHQEMAGLWAQLAKFDEGLPSDAVILFDNGDVGRALPATMELAFDHPSLSLQQPRDEHERQAIDGLVQAAREQDRPVYLACTGGDLEWPSVDWEIQSRGIVSLQVPRLAQVEGRPPSWQDKSVSYYVLDLYEIVPAQAATSPRVLPQDGLRIPLGAGSRAYLRGGFYAAEPYEDDVFRWTGASSRVELPWPGESDTATFCLQLRVAGGRPGDEAPAELTVLAEGQMIHQQKLSYDYAPSIIDIPIAGIANGGNPHLELELRVNTWSPADHGSSDARELGIAMYGLALATDCE